MKHGRAVIPEPTAVPPSLDPEGDGKPNQWSRRTARRTFLPDDERGAARRGEVTTERAVLDAEGRAWLARALLEFRSRGPSMRAKFVAWTLRPTTEKEIEYAKIDEDGDAFPANR